jgi:hypothetical protein
MFWLWIVALVLAAGVVYLGAVFAGLAVAAGKMAGRGHVAADPDATQEHYREVARNCARNAQIALTLAALTVIVLLLLMR